MEGEYSASVLCALSRNKVVVSRLMQFSLHEQMLPLHQWYGSPQWPGPCAVSKIVYN